MTGYVALLRGINVGGNKKIVMAELRELLTRLGYADVRTHLNSGNAVFSCPRSDPDQLAARIERAISADLGVNVRCLIRDEPELRAVIAANPWPEHADEGSKLMAIFLSATPSPALLQAHDPCALEPSTIALGHRAIYQWCPDGILQAPRAGGFAEKYLGVTVTARNWNTVTKLALRACA